MQIVQVLGLLQSFGAVPVIGAVPKGPLGTERKIFDLEGSCKGFGGSIFLFAFQELKEGLGLQ